MNTNYNIKKESCMAILKATIENKSIEEIKIEIEQLAKKYNLTNFEMISMILMGFTDLRFSNTVQLQESRSIVRKIKKKMIQEENLYFDSKQYFECLLELENLRNKNADMLKEKSAIKGLSVKSVEHIGLFYLKNYATKEEQEKYFIATKYKNRSLSEEEINALETEKKYQEIYDEIFKVLTEGYTYEIALEKVAAIFNLSVRSVDTHCNVYLKYYATESERKTFKKEIKKTENDKLELIDKLTSKILTVMHSSCENKKEIIYNLLNGGFCSEIYMKTEAKVIASLKKELEKCENFSEKYKVLDIVNEIDSIFGNYDTIKPSADPIIKIARNISWLVTFLQSNETIEDFISHYKSQLPYTKPSQIKKYFINCIKRFPELESIYVTHCKRIEEYEDSFLDELTHVVFNYVINGVQLKDGSIRDFTIIDYYMLTRYPFEKFAIKLNNRNAYSSLQKKYGIEKRDKFFRFIYSLNDLPRALPTSQSF